MLYVVTLFIGVAVGALCVLGILWDMRSKLKKQRSEQDAQEKKIRETLEAAGAERRGLERQAGALRAQVVLYQELENENTLLKRDLHNIDVDLRKLQLDRELQRKDQAVIDKKVTEVGSRHLKENVKWIGSSLTPNNFVNSKQRLKSVIDRCRAMGFAVTSDEETALLDDLKTDYEKAVRAAFEREEQARIKAQIREEQKLEKEIERELKHLERERAAIKAALEKALAEAKDEHSEEVERLKARLGEAEAKSERAIARAQMTRSGHVYVISNVGSFGDGVFKIGMTRRLEPADRVRELGDASVPFPFDVHMMVSSDDAPKLENALHRALHTVRLNKINPRKEFFKADLDAIHEIVLKEHGEVEYTVDAEALQYRQSLEMSEEDSEFIERAYDTLREGREASGNN